MTTPRKLTKLFTLLAYLAAFAMLPLSAFAQTEPPVEGTETTTTETTTTETTTTTTTSTGDYSSISGEWGSEWGPVTIAVTGSDFSGSWTQDGTVGTMTGTIEGNEIWYDWTYGSSKGKGYFAIIEMDGETRLVGSWGYDMSHNNAADWTCYR